MKKKDASSRAEAAIKPQGDSAGSEPAQAMLAKPASREAMFRAKEEDEPLLENKVRGTGQQRALRRLLLDSGLYTAEAIAVMTETDVCTCIQLGYAVVGVCDDGNDILLVKRDRLAEYNGLITHIRR